MKNHALTLTLLFLLGAVLPVLTVAESAETPKCIFSIRLVARASSGPVKEKDGLFFYGYVSRSDYVWVERYTKGQKTDSFSMPKYFAKHIRDGFSGEPFASLDWGRHLREVEQKLSDKEDYISVTDGIAQEITIDCEGARCSFVAENPLVYIEGYARFDPVMERLKTIINAFMAAYGKAKLNNGD